MAILVDEATRVLVQGATGKHGSYHTRKMRACGVKIVGGVTPGRGGQMLDDVPIFNTVREACQHSPVDAAMIIVPPAGVLGAAREAIENGIPLVVVITEFVPLHDSMLIRATARQASIRVIGPNTIGVISPGQSQVGIMPGFIYSQGSIGIISRSGTLMHEIASNLTYRNMGQSTCVGIGGDAVKGSDFVDVLEWFKTDPQTGGVILIGEIGGGGEEQAAAYIRDTAYPKPVYGFIAGATAPRGKRMGHAGAIIAGNMGTAQSKVSTLAAAGVNMAATLDELLTLAAVGMTSAVS